MPVGRPTGYDPDYCEQAREFIAQGFSLTAFAGHLGVSRQTVYNWADQYPEFLDAVKTGQAGGVLWWERRNKEFAATGEGNATAIIFGLKNRAADEWRDVSRTEHTGADGGPVTVKAQPAEWTIVDPEAEGRT